MSVALYRKYRSKTLDEIIGQEHITDILRRALASQSIAHAYLLTGPRGTGKTSVARILAHEINNLPYTDEDDHLDIIEIDAASNNGVDDVRDLRDKALIAPVAAAKKIYIIDEVHMLSKQAFNALLKMLEEPPEHIVFILATTDVDKVPVTIKSRTQRFHFHLVDTEKVSEHLAHIAKKEKISIDIDALEIIAEQGGGSFRDSISLLDQIRHTSNQKITREMVENGLGLAQREHIENLTNAVKGRNPNEIIDSIQSIEQTGVSAGTLAGQLRTHFYRQISTNPSLVHFLEGLGNVSKSSHPDITLLVTLLSRAHIASDTSAPENSSKKITKKSTTVSSTVTPKPQAITAPIAPKPKIAPAKKPAPKKPISDFDWDKVLSFIAEKKSGNIGLYSLLQKCTPQIKDDALTLYAVNSFNKKRLESSKNLSVLYNAIAETHGGDIELEVVASSAPPKDEQVAKIAAMMGGGEEIDV